MKHYPTVKRVNSAPMARTMEHPFGSMNREMNEMIREFFRDFAPLTLPSMDRLWKGWGMTEPKFEVKETEREYEITAELPGLDENDIDLSIEHGMLILNGGKKHEREEKKKGRFFSERNYREYYSAFPLPGGIESEKARTAFRKGVLKVTIPKMEKSKVGKKA